MITQVHCSCCKQIHNTKEVEFLNIEEDTFGQDLMTFVCPNKNEVTKALVYSSSFSDENMDYWKD